eukprot:TRINITY_DN4960_c0_g1_i2.p1 TRINITY_DN4960_c0_g1~~TRINITY_DN4960_c0_g1_i2.p1  ORF type:complete len:665 (+),score=178.55 TRINITY_DN4960_c0_g1_i2:203-1996(+)
MPMMGQQQMQQAPSAASSGPAVSAPAAASQASIAPEQSAGSGGAPGSSPALGRKENLLHDLDFAAKELERKQEEEKHASRETGSREDAPSRSAAAEHKDTAKRPEEASKPPEREKTPPRCHLHPAKKPNAKCKFCQRAQQSAAKGKADDSGKSNKEDGGSASSRHKKGSEYEAEEEDYSRRTFNCSPMLKDQILGSSYFKSMLQLTTMEEIIDEISNYADTLDVYNIGSMTVPSCFACQVYRIFTLPEAEDLTQLQVILDHPTSATVRCAGFLYMRFVVPPMKLFEKLEEYLFDDMKLTYQDGGKSVTTTIGEYVEDLMAKEKYFNKPLPRVPVKVKQYLEKELAPMSEYRKRMKAHAKNNIKKIAGTAVEVYHDGSWVPGTAQEFVGKVVKGRKVKVDLEDGGSVEVHMGKVVLRGDGDRDEDKGRSDDDSRSEEGSRSGSEDDGKKKRRKRSRSRRRGRSSSQDWCRYKGKSDKELIEAMRDKAREDAVCAYGSSYSRRRPHTMEESLWMGERDTRVSMLGSDSRSDGSSRKRSEKEREEEENQRKAKMRREEEEEHKKRMRDIYEKYGSAKTSAYGSGSGARKEIDQPDILRLG